MKIEITQEEHQRVYYFSELKKTSGIFECTKAPNVLFIGGVNIYMAWTVLLIEDGKISEARDYWHNSTFKLSSKKITIGN